jgi:hypothetical protein
MTATALKSASRLVFAVLLLTLAVWARPLAAAPEPAGEVDWCAECAAGFACIPCCRCDGGTPTFCKMQCLP